MHYYYQLRTSVFFSFTTFRAPNKPKIAPGIPIKKIPIELNAPATPILIFISLVFI